MKKIAIIGAGPAGMTAAYMLSKNGYNIDIYEAGDKIGGLSQSLSLWNQTVDLGPHRFFSSDPRVNELWLEVVGGDYEMVSRLTRIYYKKHFFNYPLKPFNALSNLGVVEAVKCLWSYFFYKPAADKTDGSFEDWVKSRFGNRLFGIFFKTYTEKLWGIPCKELDADFAAQRIKKLSLFEAIKNAFLEGKSNKHRTLVDEFAYPNGGTGAVYEKMACYIKKQGNNIYMEKPVYRVSTNDQKVNGIELMDGTSHAYDHVVSCMPYSMMVGRLSEAPQSIKELAKRLTYRNTIIVYLLINKTNLFPDNWLYIHAADLQMGRITNFRNWVPSLYGSEQKSILALEYWSNEDEELWQTRDADLVELARREMASTGLVGVKDIEEGYVHRIPKSYPVYNRGYKEALGPIEQYTNAIDGLHAIGRNGSFKYNNQDHSILMGIMAAENIMNDAGHDLSDINSDYDTYQEACVITNTGLVKQVE